MAEPERVTPEEIYERVKSGAAFLVCAYEDDQKFNAFHLEGAIPFSEFIGRFYVVSMDREIIFYCA